MPLRFDLGVTNVVRFLFCLALWISTDLDPADTLSSAKYNRLLSLSWLAPTPCQCQYTSHWGFSARVPGVNLVRFGYYQHGTFLIPFVCTSFYLPTLSSSYYPVTPPLLAPRQSFPVRIHKPLRISAKVPGINLVWGSASAFERLSDSMRNGTGKGPEQLISLLFCLYTLENGMN